ncbi:BNR-4 repeat-containing protein [Pedobacter sp. MW01-1-1]|uniref:BNR-4 repeat-containing protein n=1 Tax=Pedobacter sp. MW01-1-1 TaxID=3383027 RepID=UPI003FEF3837
MKRLLMSFAATVACYYFVHAQVQTLNQKDTGYKGIWYSNQPSNDEYVYKYSGGLGTYPANHYPFSVYVKAVNKTFFCYGGSDLAGKTLLHVVSYFDHNTGMVPKPTIVLDKKTNNAHDNPVLNIDKDGFIWLFSTAHGTNSPSYVHKSTKPYSIDSFIRVDVTKQVAGKKVLMDNFSYLQVWYQPNNGFINLFTHYDRKVIPNQPSKPRRTISYMTSSNGVNYSEWKDLAIIEEGHYQTSGSFRDVVATSFNFHPVKDNENGLNYRTNLYYIQTKDFGKTWQNVKNEKIDVPLTDIRNVALVKDYQSLGLNVYINDLAFDASGNPIILFITSKGYQAGPINAPYTWNTARYTGNDWEILPVTISDNNYDMGSLVVDEKGNWLIVGPTATGPQAFNTGGEMVLWTSNNKGKTWKSKKITSNSLYNHSYARKPVNVHPGFFAFWADGHGRQHSVSRLYFADKKGNVYQLPEKMDANMVKPIKLKQPKK